MCSLCELIINKNMSQFLFILISQFYNLLLDNQNTIYNQKMINKLYLNERKMYDFLQVH